MRYIVLFPVLVVAAACDPAAGIRIGTRLAPGPEPLCIDSVVTHSSLLVRVDTVDQPDHASRRSVFLYNLLFELPTEPSVAGLYLDPSTDDSTNVTVWFAWIGRLRTHSGSAREAAVSQGIALLREVQAACAPPANTPIKCEEYEAPGKGRPCSVG
jgi:hypothetical protein